MNYTTITTLKSLIKEMKVTETNNLETNHLDAISIQIREQRGFTKKPEDWRQGGKCTDSKTNIVAIKK